MSGAFWYKCTVCGKSGPLRDAVEREDEIYCPFCDHLAQFIRGGQGLQEPSMPSSPAPIPDDPMWQFVLTHELFRELRKKNVWRNYLPRGLFGTLKLSQAGFDRTFKWCLYGIVVALLLIVWFWRDQRWWMIALEIWITGGFFMGWHSQLTAKILNRAAQNKFAFDRMLSLDLLPKYVPVEMRRRLDWSERNGIRKVVVLSFDP